MDQELQWLIKNLYGDRQLTDEQLSNIIKSWESNHMGYRDNMKNAVLNKIKLGLVNLSNSTLSNKSNKPNSPAFLRPTVSQTQPVSAVQQIPTKPTTAATSPSNDFSSIANFNEAFRQASKAGLKTFVWKKTKGNPSGLFSTEVASKQSETEKPALKPKEKKSGESTPASKGQPLTKKEYAFDGSRIDIGKMPYIDEDQGYTEFGSDSELNVVPGENSVLPYIYPWDTTITNPYQWLKLPEPELEITGNALSDKLRKLLEEYMKYHNGVRYKVGYGRDSNFMAKGGTMNKVNYFKQGGQPQNGQADAFMQSVLQGNSEAIGQLIEAAKQGDKNADKLIQTILQEDKKGNQQVTKAASVIKQLLNQTTSAKWGSKLEYIRSLKFAKGGKSCPVCEQQKVEMKKCGGKKAKKHYFGGWL